MCWEKEGLWDTIADCLESAHGYIDLVFTLAVRLAVYLLCDGFLEIMGS